jgi:CBS domain-containing protein
MGATVADVMRPGVMSCAPDASLVTVAQTMATHHVHSEPIDVRARFGTDADAAYAAITSLMQRTLDALAAERRFPVIG